MPYLVYLIILLVFAGFICGFFERLEYSRLRKRFAQESLERFGSIYGLIQAAQDLQRSRWLRMRLKKVLVKNLDANRQFIRYELETNATGSISHQEACQLYRYVLLADPETDEEAAADIRSLEQAAAYHRKRLGFPKPANS